MRGTLRFSFAIALIAVFMLPISAYAQAWSGILAPSRAVDWSSAGVLGGIPARTTICSTLSPGATGAQINSAIAACPIGQVVFLNAGTYNLSGGILVNSHNGVTIRGAGADKTFLVFSSDNACQGFRADICFQSSDLNYKNTPSNLVNWTSGYASGTTSIVLTSVPNLKVGYPIILDQLDDTTDSGGVYVCATTNPPCSLEGGGGNSSRNGRQQFQIVTVTGCGGVTTPGAACSGTNVTVNIAPGLYMPNWSAAKNPQAWWSNAPLQDVGIENLSIDNTNSGSGASGVEIFNCLNCWVMGVRSIDSARAHVEIQYSAHVTVRDSYFFLTQNSVSQSYGVECYGMSDSLVENNIFQAIASPEMENSPCSGSVISYNFNINNFYVASSGYSIAGTNQHAVIDNMLYEGNVGNQFYGDVFHGTHQFVTAFRNYWSGVQPVCYASGSSYANATFAACNNNLIPVVAQAYSRFYNFVGNVLGKTGVQNGYDTGSTPIFVLGNGNSNGTVTVPKDLNVPLTVLRWGNYDTFNAATRFVSTEVPSLLSGVQAPFLNPVPVSQTLPASFYLNAKPKWWPGSKAWPPIGPDVTGGNVAGVAGHAYTIPAQDCFFNVMGGPANGTGPVLSFNASTCYGSGSASLPAPPTGLTAIVH